jgi:hypothetical protein
MNNNCLKLNRSTVLNETVSHRLKNEEQHSGSTSTQLFDPFV